MYSFEEFNLLEEPIAKEKLFTCCGSTEWVRRLLQNFPFSTEKELFDAARNIWYEACAKEDYFEAFRHHPKIGDLKSLAEKFASTKEWAGEEQAEVQEASTETLKELASLNQDYLQKYGYIFIVCASGRSAKEMLALLKNRMTHDEGEELLIAMGEQFKITLLRLQKLIDFQDARWKSVSQITTHVLDTSQGFPGKGMCIRLKRHVKSSWQTIGIGITNSDGRIADLLPSGVSLLPGEYQVSFDTKAYFQQSETPNFYPKVDIHFRTTDSSHYHVPLLINPFGYTTYRGS